MTAPSSRNWTRRQWLGATATAGLGGLGLAPRLSAAYFEEPLAAGQWIHVIATFDPPSKSNSRAGVSLYRDGVLRKGPSLPGSSGTLYSEYQITPTHRTAPVRLGACDVKHHFLIGGLDEVAIYPQVLTAAEIREHWMIGSKG